MIDRIDYNKKMKVFFIGIGGISMSALAMILKNENYEVIGSDNSESEDVKKLVNNGIKVYIGHKKEHITDDIDLVVYTSAVHNDNEELIEARNKNIECIQRSKLLGFIMKNYHNVINVAGTHGKTTITSIISKVLIESGYEPTVTVGGILKDIGGNLFIGKNNNLFVAEACEYTNSFLDFYPNIEVISNIDADHLDFFKDINDIRNSFSKFISHLDENGILVINKNIKDIDELTKNYKGKIVTYGVNANADYDGRNIKKLKDGQEYDLYKKNQFLSKIKISIFGNHNVDNSIGAVATLLEYGVDINKICNIIKNFYGCNRRLEKKAYINGITIIDDYAHHPNEIRASIEALKELVCENMYVVFQPHTYSRTKVLFDDFVDVLKNVDNLIMVDIYAAREKNIYGISSKDIVDEINKKYNKNAIYKSSFEEAIEYMKNIVKENDIIVTMGAGDVYKVGDDIIKGYNKNNI